MPAYPPNIPKRLLISRTDSLGDVVLTLPLAGWLKSQYPDVFIAFLGRTYSRPLLERCQHIDAVLTLEEVRQNQGLLSDLKLEGVLHVFPDKEVAQLCAQARIPLRIGTSHRWWNWLYANRRVSFSRRNSPLHEAQLNFELLKGLKISHIPGVPEIPDAYGLQGQECTFSFLDPNKQTWIIHPKSKGSAREWPLDKYLALARQLDPNRYQILLTGTEAEGALIRQQCPELLEVPGLVSLLGQLSLGELIDLIAQVEGLVACSTGPLHIASALGKRAIGLYPPMVPIHPGRWRPLGIQAHTLVLSKSCEDCRNGGACACIAAIDVGQVLAFMG